MMRAYNVNMQHSLVAYIAGHEAMYWENACIVFSYYIRI